MTGGPGTDGIDDIDCTRIIFLTESEPISGLKISEILPNLCMMGPHLYRPEIRDRLQTLELNRLPDAITLARSFKRLLKIYHPDRNARRREWAHEKTRELIDAHTYLRDYIKQHGETQKKLRRDGRFRVERRNRYNERESGGPGGEANRSNPDFSGFLSNSFQLIESNDGNYAIPVHNIITVLSARGAIERSENGFFCRYDRRSYPLIALNERTFQPDDASYIILFRTAWNICAIALDGAMKLGKIETFSHQEKVFVNGPELRDRGWILHREKYYFFPQRILAALGDGFLS